MEAVTHAPVNFRRDTHRSTGAGLHWSRINAGNRAQVELPGTNTRHFRVASTTVKSGEAVVPVARPFQLPSLWRRKETVIRPTTVLSLTAVPDFS
jgi:hypothetical protein